jgi:hypothetical protein
MPTVNSHTTIGPGGLILNCTRQFTSDAVQITISTDKGTLMAKLPDLTPPSLVSTKILEPQLEPPLAACTDDTKYKRNIDDKAQSGNQPVYVCP